MSSTLHPHRPGYRARLAASRLLRREDPLLWFILSPAVCVLVIWLIGLLAFWIASGLRDDLLYLRFMAAAVNLREEATLTSVVWLIMAYLAFLVGTLLVRPRPPSAVPLWSDRSALNALTVAFVIIFTVAFLWAGTTVLTIGLGRMIALANSNNIYARELLLEGAFPGGRLISNGFIGTAVFSAMFLAKPRQQRLPAEAMVRVWLILAVSLAYLGLIPILTSGRINFFVSIIAAYVAVSVIRGRFSGLVYIPFGIALLIVVWSAKQYFSLRHVMNVSLWDQSYQGLLFYLYNDIINAMNIVGNLDGNYNLGYYSMRFMFFFTFTDGAILNATEAARMSVGQYIGGGEFPMLTSPYVDFGYAGILLLVVFGAFSQWAYQLARTERVFGALYGLVFAGLIMSIHSCFLTSQDLVFGMIVAGGLTFIATGRLAAFKIR